MEQLAAFVVYREKLETITLLQRFDRNELFQFLLKELYKEVAFKDQKLICGMIGRVLGLYAETWVSSIWEDKPDHIDTRLRSYLTAMCTSKDKGLLLVFNFLESSNKKITGYEALSHLGDFHSRDVISWMENDVKFPVTEGWDELFLRSNFSWDDLKRWTSLEEKHEVTVIHALEKYVHEKSANNEFSYVISGLPSKSELIDFLVELRKRQVLKKRILPIENVIQNIDIFY
ncbi:hypothetical protein LIS82_24995 [Cytobacillus solani]|uniref:Uncharacterized protein n=1 Tax=Cytobacillus solani TaxID=1637975 RepID=A0A0Q3QUM1_9BACI|nr:hypothetical protein [Cytobacillus solani]KQL21454.1 hypothetical protein AN957_24820 [Cytobacillus solani]USK54758.1 hypothetical protein LIS82_24995 [Cytobacillus solani]